MPKYKFSEIALNITDKKMPESGDEELYIGLEHLDSGSLRVTRWGSEVELVGQKLVMQKGDILFGRRNTYLRRAAIAPHDGIFSAHGMIFRPKTDVIDPDYFPFFISSDYFMDAAIRISVGSLSPTVNWKTLKELEFYLPDLNQQRHTAELLSAANETKEAYQDLLSKTDELVKSQFIELFGDPITNEKRWPLSAFSDSCYIVTGNTPSRKVPEYYGNYIEWIKSDNISPNSLFLRRAAESLSEEGKKVGRVVPVGSILMTCIAGSLNTIGNVSIADREVAFNQQINAFIPKQYETYFLYYLLAAIRPQLHEVTNNALKCILNKGTLESVNAIVPDRALQIRFSDIAQQLDKSKFELKQAIANISELMKSLIQQDFTN